MFYYSGNLYWSTVWLESGRRKIVISLGRRPPFALQAVYCSISHSISGVELRVALRQAEKAIKHALSDLNDQWHFHLLYCGAPRIILFK